MLEIAVGKGCERGGVREGRRWVLESRVSGGRGVLERGC